MHDPRNDELLREGLRRLPEVRAGEGFTRRVLARIEAEERGSEAHRNGGPGRWSAPPWPAPATRWAVAAAAGLTLAVTAALLLSSLGGPAPATGPDSAAEAGEAPAGAPAAAASPAAPAPDRLAAVDLAPPEVPLRESEPAADDPGPGADPAGSPAGGGAPSPEPGTEDRGATPGEGQPRGEGSRGDLRRARDDGGASQRAAGPSLTDTDAARRRLAELRQRQRAVRAELAALSGFAQGDRAPALLLGGDESVELVVGLDRRRTADASAVRPAVHRPEPGGSGPRYF